MKLIHPIIEIIELIIMGYAAIFLLQDAIRFDPMTWVTQYAIAGRQVRFKQFLITHLHPRLVQGLEFVLGILFLYIALWILYKKIRKKC